jgi:hypothetical protein
MWIRRTTKSVRVIPLTRIWIGSEYVNAGWYWRYGSDVKAAVGSGIHDVEDSIVGRERPLRGCSGARRVDQMVVVMLCVSEFVVY